jgi:hypothetical protein
LIAVLKMYRWDFNDRIGSRPVPRFEDAFPEEAKALEKVFWDYAKLVQAAEEKQLNANDQEGESRRNKKRALPVMDRSPLGYPMLPAWCESEKDLQYKKDLIRSFLSEHYGGRFHQLAIPEY